MGRELEELYRHKPLRKKGIDMDWIIANWPILAATIIPTALTLLWAIAQLTENTTDDKIVIFLRKLWGMIPVGETKPQNMGKKKG